MRKLIANRQLCGIFYFRKQPLKFQSSLDIISDEDIMSLFLGFVRLIKKSVEIEMENKYQKTIKSLQLRLKSNKQM